MRKQKASPLVYRVPTIHEQDTHRAYENYRAFLYYPIFVAVPAPSFSSAQIFYQEFISEYLKKHCKSTQRAITGQRGFKARFTHLVGKSHMSGPN